MGAGRHEGKNGKVIPGFFPSFRLGESAAGGKHDPHQAGVGYHGNRRFRCFFQQKIDFAVGPGGELPKRFSTGSGHIGTVLCPALCRKRVTRLNLLPGQALPKAEVDFAQPRPKMKIYAEVSGDSRGGLLRAAQVTAIHVTNFIRRQPIHKVHEMMTPWLIEFRVGMTAKAASHGGFSVADEKKIAHALNTPQK